jgi:hypothetical protein
MLWYLLVYRYLIHALSLSRSSTVCDRVSRIIAYKIMGIFSIYFRVREEEYEDHNKLALLSHPLKLKFKLFHFLKHIHYGATDISVG